MRKLVEQASVISAQFLEMQAVLCKQPLKIRCFALDFSKYFWPFLNILVVLHEDSDMLFEAYFLNLIYD